MFFGSNKNFKVEICRYGKKIKKTKKRNNTTQIVVLLFICLAVALFIIKDLELYLRSFYSEIPRNSSYYLTWIGSLGSFWGGVFGGAASGLISIIGILLTIRYYRKQDSSNKIEENKPFLNIEKVKLPSGSLKNVKEDDVLCKIGNGEQLIYVPVRIENIGNNFARTLTYNNGSNFGGYEFNNIIKVGEMHSFDTILEFRYDEDMKDAILLISFLDCYMNEYYQNFEFSLSSNKEDVKIIAGFPELIESTFR